MRNSSRWILPLALALALLPRVGAAQGYEYDDEVRQSVARIAYVTGEVSYNRGDEPDEWSAPAVNFPMTIGDRIWAARDGRVEVQSRGASVFVASETELAALNLTEDVQQYSLTQGTLTVRLRRLAAEDAFEVDTPNSAVTFDGPGDYRIDVDRDGNTRVVVRRGRAVVAAGGGQVPLEAGDEMEIDGLDVPTYDVYAASRLDGWDRWVESRASRFGRARYAAYVNADVIGWDDLDTYGRWNSIPGYGYCWSPASVAADWAPYRYGRWVWQDPWGWSWVSNEPWGFAPYHYGRWVSWSSRWWWVPAGPRVHVAYAPALVAFVGGGPGWSASVSVGGGYVGWFPLAPHDPFIPWWGTRRYDAPTNYRYVNRTYVTVVQQNVFVSGNLVARNFVRDPGVLRTVVSEPVLRGPLPVMPTRSSLRVSIEPARVLRPPAPIAARAVVTRLAPPPAPPSFGAKVEVIRENRGLPVSPIVASRISIERHDGARAVVPIRPVAEERVVLRSRREGNSVPRPVAVTAPAGRALATAERPFIGSPAGAAPRAERSERPAPPQPARGAVVAPRGAPPAQGAPEAAPGRAGEPRGPFERAIERDRQERAAPPAREAPPAQREAPPARGYERERPAPPPERAVPPAERERVTPPPTQERRVAPPPPEERGRPFERAQERERQQSAPPPAAREAPPSRGFERATPPPPAREAPPAERPAPPPARERAVAPPPQERQAAPPPPAERGRPFQRAQERERQDSAPPPPAARERQAPPPPPPAARERQAPPPEARERQAPPPQERAEQPRGEGRKERRPPPTPAEEKKDDKKD